MRVEAVNIVEQFNQGRPEAFSQLFDLYYSRIRLFAYKITGSREDAEDLTVESFTKLFARYQDFDSEANIRAFLYIATRNAAFNLLKSRQKTKEGHKELTYLSGEEGTLDNAQIEGELIEMIYRAIESLPPERKRVFKMLYIEGLKLADVAEQLGISINTVKSHRAKAIIALKALLSAKAFSYVWLMTH